MTNNERVHAAHAEAGKLFPTLDRTSAVYLTAFNAFCRQIEEDNARKEYVPAAQPEGTTSTAILARAYPLNLNVKSEPIIAA